MPTCPERPSAIAALLLLGALSGCVADDGAHAPLTASQTRTLARALDGKVAGAPVACVRIGLGSDGPRAITDDVLLYRINRDLVYRNDLNGHCTGISSNSALVLKPTNGEYCRGDIAYAYDTGVGMRGGSCVLGDFVPYRTVGK